MLDDVRIPTSQHLHHYRPQEHVEVRIMCAVNHLRHVVQEIGILSGWGTKRRFDMSSTSSYWLSMQLPRYWLTSAVPTQKVPFHATSRFLPTGFIPCRLRTIRPSTSMLVNRELQNCSCRGLPSPTLIQMRPDFSSCCLPVFGLVSVMISMLVCAVKMWQSGHGVESDLDKPHC